MKYRNSFFALFHMLTYRDFEIEIRKFERKTDDFLTANGCRVLLINRIAVLRPTFSTACIEFLLLVSRSVILTYQLAFKSPRYCTGET